MTLLYLRLTNFFIQSTSWLRGVMVHNLDFYKRDPRSSPTNHHYDLIWCHSSPTKNHSGANSQISWGQNFLWRRNNIFLRRHDKCLVSAPSIEVNSCTKVMKLDVHGPPQLAPLKNHQIHNIIWHPLGIETVDVCIWTFPSLLCS